MLLFSDVLLADATLAGVDAVPMLVYSFLVWQIGKVNILLNPKGEAGFEVIALQTLA